MSSSSSSSSSSYDPSKPVTMAEFTPNIPILACQEQQPEPLLSMQLHTYTEAEKERNKHYKELKTEEQRIHLLKTFVFTKDNVKDIRLSHFITQQNCESVLGITYAEYWGGIFGPPKRIPFQEVEEMFVTNNYKHVEEPLPEAYAGDMF